jgi:hypothetical protein
VQNRALRVKGGQPFLEATPHWVTAEEDVEAADWADLAAKLKGPAAKKAATEECHRLRVFNRLSADGWELAGHRPKSGSAGTEAWTFRRKARK